MGLDGKWIWVWNWRRCDGGDPQAVANRLKAAGCAGVLVKAFDGGHWYDQGLAFRDIAPRLKARGVGAGAWGYLYGEDAASEAARAIETAQYGEADLLVLDVETEFKGHPEAALEVCQRIREALGPAYPVYFSSFAIARYHRSFPFEEFRPYCAGTAPQVYWNAFRWPLEQAMGWTYDDYLSLQMPASSLYPVGGLYQEGSVTYPPVEQIGEFIRSAAARGSRGVSFWSYEHMDNEMWSAVAAAPWVAQEIGEEDEMSSQEYETLTQQLVAVGTRVQRLESEVASLSGGLPSPAPEPAPRTYTVQSGDTLSGIAQKLGLSGWQSLYQANAGVIGGDPNRIYAGQVLVLP
ncbi:MAG: LysM peptidoglycan-binding domain-containing protein [Chloroflexota bacterium]